MKYNISKTSVHNIVRYSARNPQGKFPYKAKKKIGIDSHTQEMRLLYAEKYINADFKNYIFVDEKNMRLGKMVNAQNNRRCCKKKCQQGNILEIDTKRFNRSLNFSYYGVSDIYWFMSDDDTMSESDEKQVSTFK